MADELGPGRGTADMEKEMDQLRDELTHMQRQVADSKKQAELAEEMCKAWKAAAGLSDGLRVDLLPLVRSRRKSLAWPESKNTTMRSSTSLC